MKSTISGEEVEFTEEEFFHLGLNVFLKQDTTNFEKIIIEKLIDFSEKNGMSVEFEFFQEISKLGKQTLFGELN